MGFRTRTGRWWRSGAFANAVHVLGTMALARSAPLTTLQIGT
jgi:hypothetical protein